MGNQTSQTSEAIDDTILNVIRCPCCQSEKLFIDQALSSICCQNCQQKFPFISFGEIEIPFLFSDVSIALFDWCARINGFNKKYNEEIETLGKNIDENSISKLTKQRLKNSLKAKKNFQMQITEHLKYFEMLSDTDLSYHSTKLAKNQGVDSYINNIFRDWCWENDENDELFSAVESVVKKEYRAGQCATLGAGASRLSYDFHNAYQSEHSVLIDINPILLGYAKRILNKEKIKLNEFPVAPLTSSDFNVEQEIQFNEKYIDSEFTFLLADGLNAPLKSKTFDTVLTPWFIDIVPVDFKEVIPHINRMLKVGGSWINTGSLAFFHDNESWNYSEEEILDLLKKYGFHEIVVNRKEINYLHSPHSAHRRIENVFSFNAKKKFDCISASAANYLPDWVEDTHVPIPQQDKVIASSSKYLLQAQVLSAVDGHRSIVQIGKLLAKQYGMNEEQAVAAVRQILIDNC